MYDMRLTIVKDGVEEPWNLPGYLLIHGSVPKRLLINPRDEGRGHEDVYTFDLYERQDDGKYHFAGTEERFQYTGKVEPKETT